MLKKILFPIIIIGSFVLVGFLGWSAFQEVETKKPKEAPTTEDEFENMSVDEIIEYENSKPDDRKRVNPFGDAVSKDGLTRRTVLEYIHYMSHQKVKAYAKWGFIEMTEERINWLHDAVNKYNDKIELSKKERAILDRWARKDFSEIVFDHNYVHNDVSSEKIAIGKGIAEDVLSPEEEKKYIENTEEINEIRN